MDKKLKENLIVGTKIVGMLFFLIVFNSKMGLPVEGNLKFGAFKLLFNFI